MLDDDPTGTQAVHDVPVLLAWEPEMLRRAARGARAIHLMTNARALPPTKAHDVTFAAAEAVHRFLPGTRFVLRGDSTLRGHVWEEYQAVREAGFAGRAPVLLLVPALPAAGRVTRGGVQWLLSHRGAVSLNETEYARDGVFSYRSAHLLSWADERSGGRIPAAAGTELPLQKLREIGATAVRDAIIIASQGDGPVACAPDAESIPDLTTIAEGLRLAEASGIEVVVRCAPTFAGVLAGTLAEAPVPPPHPGERGALVVCGSYVSCTTRQLQHLSRALAVDPVEIDVLALTAGGDEAKAEIRRAAAAAQAGLAARRLAVLSTPRKRPEGTLTLEAGARIAEGLAQAVADLDPPPAVLIAKGGITSQVVLKHGLEANEALVKGPVIDGVAEWQVIAHGHEVAYLVFPGNVGGEDHLTMLVQTVMES